ncbi:MAG TPA: Ku protein [Bryobacteraceae bacterium]|jgi:DNA end-binding protein Ku|nr:Ku protein [Bryobacteraceae bacterium]
MASTVWRGYITFGLISIPVRLFRAARAERVSFRRLYREEPAQNARPLQRVSVEEAPEPEPKTLRSLRRAEAPIESAGEPPRPLLSPVKQVSVRRGTDEVLPEKSVVKGYEYEQDRFVALEPEELKNAASRTSTQMEIQEFVQLSEIDPVYFETSYYVSPEQAGEKAYSLLYRALQTTGLIALAQFAMHGREHVVVLRPGKTGIVAHTMFFASEVRAEEEYRADTSAVAPKELDLAQTLIHSLTAPFEPEKYRDTYRERLESIIAKKVQGEPVTAVEPVQRPAEVVDIADALRRSLANLKKPAASEQEPPKQAKASLRTSKASRGAGPK